MCGCLLYRTRQFLIWAWTLPGLEHGLFSAAPVTHGPCADIFFQPSASSASRPSPCETACCGVGCLRGIGTCVRGRPAAWPQVHVHFLPSGCVCSSSHSSRPFGLTSLFLRAHMESRGVASACVGWRIKVPGAWRQFRRRLEGTRAARRALIRVTGEADAAHVNYF